MTEHTLRQYDIELEEIRRRILNMGGLAEAQVVKAIEGLRSGQIDLLDTVVEGDKPINLAQIELDDACSHIIAKRQPAAGDLRLVLAVIKIASDLERIGDEAKKIAKAARRLHGAETPFVPRVGLTQAVELALELLRASLDAFARVNPEGIEDLRRKDAEIDAGFKGVMRQLITYMMEDPRTISSCLEMLFIAKAIERVGDHAMNIAEHVVFVARGEDVRFENTQAKLGKG
ncbi:MULTISPECIES: phosphate signaling complex protein PhoU [Thauera]|jgi:phosphate transport system protein|uniref:Phosphate-specific transport system accessory protein PhoU n=1 Tax=Thauera phenylacetica B4P TaxID=1234382 RepID=N6ZY71_9RHOO|nr:MULTISPECIES: phosphate signaling complex protein PhoU [Thauera]ENO97089.1 phosphate uptake regulator PhoU [Thauera phenylacetica B4P]HRO35645.1 phosphate signaling complex protein PhoU [Thauera sp.]